MPELSPRNFELSKNDLEMTAAYKEPTVDIPLQITEKNQTEHNLARKEDVLANRLQEFFDHLSPEQKRKLFDREHDHSCSCIDERVIKGAVRLPGAGILIGDQVKVARMLLKDGVKDILSHEGCGAAAMATKKISESDPSIKRPAWFKEGDVDGNAERFAQAVANSMNRLRGKISNDADRVEADHLTFDNEGMKGHEHRHVANVIYYDLTKKGFNRHALQELTLPLGFVVSDREGSADEKNLKLAIEIALSNHGSTHGINEERPLAIMLLAQTKADLAEKVEITKEMISRNFPGRDKEFVIDGVLVPLEPVKK